MTILVTLRHSLEH